MSQGSGVLGSGVLGVRCPNHLQGSHVRGPVSGGPASGGQVRSSRTQTCSRYLIFTWKQENGVSDALYPLNFARSECHQKWLKTVKMAHFAFFTRFNGLE